MARFPSVAAIACLLAVLLTGPATAAEPGFVWIEGESPSRGHAALSPAGWGHPEYLSGGKWLFAAIDAGEVNRKVPAEGFTLAYDFEAPVPGPHDVWARIGYEFARAPFAWRIDNGRWADLPPDRPTTDLMALADWAEVAWLQLGRVDLAGGKHTLEFRVPRPFRGTGDKKEPDRLLFGLDCVCLSRVPFRPNGRFRPGEDHRQDLDRQAEKAAIAVPAAGGPRAVTMLGGLWQIARHDEQDVQGRTEPVRELPPGHAGLPWYGIRVPGNRDEERPDLAYCHRYLLRTRLEVPAALAGRSFVLRFPSTALIASVIVNGRFCGFSKAPCAAWDCDITAAVRPGGANEVVVAVKDVYYALATAGDGQSCRRLFNVPHEMMFKAGGMSFMKNADFPVALSVRRNGILEMPSLIVAGPLWTADVFVKPSPGRKELGLEITLRNSTDQEVPASLWVGVVPLGTDGCTPRGEPRELFHEDVRLAGNKSETLNRTARHVALTPWWPDQPQQYQVVTRLAVGGRPADEHRAKFGFREWTWTGQRFRLNGVPWSFRADTDVPSQDPDVAVRTWKGRGQNMVRYWGEKPWYGASQEETLDHFDRLGMPVRISGIFDGEAASYALVDNGKPRRDLFDNWVHQLQAWVRAHRNHPSVFIWSVENEITYINARNFGLLDQVEPEIRKAVAAVMAVDPTRPAMIDGGDALRDASLPVYGNHYNEFPLREYPDEAYTLVRAKLRYKTPPVWAPWPIDDDRPLFLGESFFASGYTPSAFAEVMGEAAFLGWPQARRGVGTFARMLSEGYRWHDVAAFHFWLGSDRSDTHYNSWQPVCVLCREWNWTFAGGGAVPRTLKVLNDTRFPETIRVGWALMLDGRDIAQGGQDVKLGPGGRQELTLNLPLPSVTRRTVGQLALTCRVGDREVFREAKPLALLPVSTATPPPLPRHDLLVWDPQGPVRDYLGRRGMAFTEVKRLEDISTSARVVVVGPDALSPRDATDPRWQALALRGTRVLVLDQDHPLHFQALPADLQVTGHAGRVAFPENLEHPAFAGLDQPDFFCWSGDHLVYRNAYKKSGRGGRSLVQCDEELSCTALAECPLRDGFITVCQLMVGRKLASDPVAARLFDNLLAHAVAYRPAAKPTALVLPEGDLRRKLLEAAGLRARPEASVAAALAAKDVGIVVADASPANLKALAASPGLLPDFSARGGWLMLWGLTPEGLADFNALVGQQHVLRPFHMERVTLPALRDPILAGLTMRDVVLESNEKIFPWSGDRYPADDTFTHVVDLDDAAPFAKSAQYEHGWAQMTNGLTSADAWKFIFYHDLGKADPHPKWSAEFPHPEEITEFSIILNTHYHLIRKMRLLFDGRTDDAVTLDLQPGAERRQDFPVNPPRKCRTITLEPVAWDAVGKQPVLGVDNIWIRVQRPEGYHKTVVPLLNIGGLVKYRHGTGGVVLNQVRVPEREANPVNAEKKQTVVATLLRNLGAPFAADRVLVPGANLVTEPVPLGEKCNAFLTADRGWLRGQPDLAHFPVGESVLGGVRYAVRDFRTSPLPACVMLAGRDTPPGLPRAVTGIPVGRPADVVYFLHAFHRTEEWRPREDRDEPPAVFKYVVHYADGKAADVPVRYDRGIGPYVSASPAGLPGAAVAWAAPFPREKSDRQAVAYAMPWTNPRPAVPIQSIDVAYDDRGGDRYGVPVLLGITLGKMIGL